MTEWWRGKRYESLDSLEESGSIGDWFVNDGSIWLWIPASERPRAYGWPKTLSRWPFKEPLENGACWKYNGNPDCPTLHPSIHAVGIFHGWLQDGILKKV